MLSSDLRLQNVQNELNARGVSAHYLKIDRRLAIRVWKGKDIFRQLLPEHKVSGEYYIVDLNYACNTLTRQETLV